MSDFAISMVIDDEVLNKLPEKRNKYILFLYFWQQEKDMGKLIVVKPWWEEFMKFWEKELKNCQETSIAFFNYIRGVATFYRKDKLEEVKEEDSVNATIQAVNRDYDEVEFLIVGTPSKYRGKTKLDDGRILTLQGFYSWMEINDADLISKFEKRVEDLALELK